MKIAGWLHAFLNIYFLELERCDIHISTVFHDLTIDACLMWIMVFF